MNKILLVEDDKDYRQTIEEMLISNGYDVTSTDSSVDALEMVAKNDYDILISDLWLDAIDGNRLSNAVKNINPNMGAIILTGNPDAETEVASFDNQVDIYLEKGKSMRVILKYVELLASKQKENLSRNNILQSTVDEIIVNCTTHEVTRLGEAVSLTPKEYKILEIFLSNKGVVLSRSDLINLIWREGIVDQESRIIDVHIKNLRTKLKTFAIVTVRGFGYMWDE